CDIFVSSRRRHTRVTRDWSSDVCSSDLVLHLVVEVVALAGTLTDAGEHRQAFVRLGDVVDQLHHVDGLADAGAAEQADLAALGRSEERRVGKEWISRIGRTS